VNYPSKQTKGSNVLLLPLNFRHSFRTKLRPINKAGLVVWLWNIKIFKRNRNPWHWLNKFTFWFRKRVVHFLENCAFERLHFSFLTFLTTKKMHQNQDLQETKSRVSVNFELLRKTILQTTKLNIMFAMLAPLSIPLFLNHACYGLRRTKQRAHISI